LILLGLEQAPLVLSHVPATWHWSVAAQTTGLPPVQKPAWHASLCVHASPSLHGVPSSLLGFEQAPVAGLHAPATWHWSGAAQTTGLAPVQAPAWQVSASVHALPSLQGAPLALAGFEQTPVAGLHAPAAWH